MLTFLSFRFPASISQSVGYKCKAEPCKYLCVFRAFIYFGSFPQSRNMHIGPTGDSKLAEGLTECVKGVLSRVLPCPHNRAAGTGWRPPTTLSGSAMTEDGCMDKTLLFRTNNQLVAKIRRGSHTNILILLPTEYIVPFFFFFFLKMQTKEFVVSEALVLLPGWFHLNSLGRAFRQQFQLCSVTFPSLCLLFHVYLFVLLIRKCA